MNQYPHHIGDFNNATRHLTRVERSIYSDMIDMYYDTEAPLVLDVPTLKRKLLARTKDEAAAVDVILAEFFEETASGWFHERCDFEITKFHGSTTQKSIAGKASAAKRQQARIKRLAELNGNPTLVEQPLKSVATGSNGTPTNLEPRTLNLEPLKINNKNDQEQSAVVQRPFHGVELSPFKELQAIDPDLTEQDIRYSAEFNGIDPLREMNNRLKAYRESQQEVSL